MTSVREIIIYKAENGQATVEVLIEKDTLWLSLNQLAELFERDKSVISRHLKTIFFSKELEASSTVAKFATVQKEGERDVERQIDFYNLDVIISVGYRVNSKRGVQFRQWANKILKDYLIQGYSLNQDKLITQGTRSLERAVSLVSRTLQHHENLSDIGQDALRLIQLYAHSWSLLLQYDDGKISLPSVSSHDPKSLPYEFCKLCIRKLKAQLMDKKESSEIFGLEKEGGLIAILGSLDQTFEGKTLYNSIEERAAHLLYFIIKDHPFSDGNKRIGCLLFLLYLHLNGIQPYQITDSALVTLALLIAESRPSEKSILIPLIVHLISLEGRNGC